MLLKTVQLIQRNFTYALIMALVGLYQGEVEKSILLVFSTTLLCPMTIPGLVYVLKGYIQNKRTASSGFQRLKEIRKFRLNRSAADIHEKKEARTSDAR